VQKSSEAPFKPPLTNGCFRRETHSNKPQSHDSCMVVPHLDVILSILEDFAETLSNVQR